MKKLKVLEGCKLDVAFACKVEMASRKPWGLLSVRAVPSALAQAKGGRPQPPPAPACCDI